MTIEITLTKEHYDHYCALVRLGVYYDKTKQALQPDFMITILFGVSLVIFAAGFLTPNELFSRLLIGSAFGFVLFWASAYLISWVQSKSVQKLVEPMEDDPLFAPIEFTFTDDAIEFKNDFGNGHYKAAKFNKFVDEYEMLLLFRSNREAYIFPKDQLSENQIVFLQEWAKERIPSGPTSHSTQETTPTTQNS